MKYPNIHNAFDKISQNAGLDIDPAVKRNLDQVLDLEIGANTVEDVDVFLGNLTDAEFCAWCTDDYPEVTNDKSIEVYVEMVMHRVCFEICVG